MGKIPEMRPLAALDRINEMVGRCAEMGRPLFLSPGHGPIEGEYAAETASGLGVMRYTAQKAASMNVNMISIAIWPPVQPLVEDVIRTAYLAEGKSDKMKAGTVRFIPGTGTMHTSVDIALMGIAERDRPAGCQIIGCYWHESLIAIEAMNAVGAMLIGGTTRTAMTPFFIAGCDYFLLGEEVMAAGAYVSDDPTAKGSFEGQDILKFIAVAIIVLGVVAINLGSEIVRSMMTW